MRPYKQPLTNMFSIWACIWLWGTASISLCLYMYPTLWLVCQHAYHLKYCGSCNSWLWECWIKIPWHILNGPRTLCHCMVYYCHTTVVSYHCSAHASLENQRRLHKLYRNNFINSCFGLLKYFVYDRKKQHVLPNEVQSQPYYVFVTKWPINMETAVT